MGKSSKQKFHFSDDRSQNRYTPSQKGKQEQKLKNVLKDVDNADDFEDEEIFDEFEDDYNYRKH